MCIVYVHESCFEFSDYYPGFSFTFEVEGHCLVSRQVHCEIEGQRPEPLGGSRGMLPRKHLKLLQSGREIFLE